MPELTTPPDVDEITPGETPDGTERADLRTAASRTYQRPDGSFITELYSDAVHYQPEGRTDWQPIDLTIAPATREGATAEVVHAPTRLSLFAADNPSGFLLIDGAGHSISLGLPNGVAAGRAGTSAQIQENGAFVDYADFLPGGIGLRVFPRADGFKTFFVVPSRPASNEFSLRIDAPGLTLAPDPEREQALVFTDAAGQVVGRIPRPFLLDSSVLETVEGGRGGGVYSEAVTQEATRQPDGSYLLTLKVDQAFLDQAVYPVYVDPTTETFPTGCSCTANDTFANSSTPNTNYNQYQRPDSPFHHEQWHGNTPGTSNYNEVFIRFNDIAETLGSGAISDTSLQFYPYWQYNHTDWKSTWVERISETWGAGTLKWSNRPATDLFIGEFQTKEGVWSDFGGPAMDAWVQDIVNGSQPNHGLKLHAASLGQGGWKRIVSSNNSSLKPKLVVTWTAFAAPTAGYPTAATGETSSRTVNWLLPASSTQSALQVQLDVDSNFTTPPTLLYDSGTVSSPYPGHMIPAGVSLTEGTKYHYRVRVKYGLNTGWSSWSNTGTIVHRQGATLGLPAHNAFESFDLGTGDTAAVNVSTGNLVISHPLVSLPIRGGSFSLGLTYNTQASANAGTGPGWRLDAMRRLVELGSGDVVLTAGDGSVHTFAKISTVGTVTTYTRPATVYATLTKDTSWANEWKLVYRDQSVDEFNVVSSEGLLAKQADRHGNAVTFAYYSGTNRLQTATDPNGRVVDFAWNTGVSPARLTSITDWAYVSSGVVQTSATGSRRQYRLFYDASGYLIGWSNPINTSGSCPTQASNLTCLTYSGGLVSAITKRQTYTTLSSGSLGTSTRDISTTIAWRGNEAAEIKDAEQAAASPPVPGTTFTRVAADQLRVVRQGSPASTTTYGFVATVDDLGRVGSVWRKLGASQIEQRTAWNSTHPTEPTSVTDNYGATPSRAISYTYAAGTQGPLVATMTEPLTGSTNRTTTYTYNTNNDVTQAVVAGPGGSTTTRYCYTTSGCSTSATDLTLKSVIENYTDGTKGGSSGNIEDVTTEYQYDANGLLTRETRWNYDDQGNLLDSRATGYVYDANGNQTKSIANFGDGDTNDAYDAAPDPATGARTDLTTVLTYDTAGNGVSSADPRRALGSGLHSDDYVTRAEFDPLNQQAKATAPRDPLDGTAPKSSATLYDELGALRQSTDFGGLVSATEYDRAGRVTGTFDDPVSGSAFESGIATFDASGRVVTSKDRNQAAGNPGWTTFEYDELGRTTKTTEAFNTGDASETTFSFDALDRQTSVTVGGIQATETTFDLGGRAIQVDDGFTCTTSTFDYRDLVLTETSGLVSDNPCTGSGDRTVSHSHDALGRLTKTAVTAGTDATAWTFVAVLDSAGRHLESGTKVVDPPAPAPAAEPSMSEFTHNPLDEVIVEARPDGSTSKSNHDSAGNATDRCYWKPAVTVGDCLSVSALPYSNQPTQLTTTAYDARNSRISLNDSVAGTTTTYDPDHNYAIKTFYVPTAAGQGHRTSYQYDSRHRLIEINHVLCASAACSSTTPTGSSDYSYDDNDNRTRVEEDNGSASSDRRYCYDALNRLQYRNTGAACSSTAKDESYSYDTGGNRLTAPGQTFTYNGNGQLTGCTSICGTVSHDSAGRTTRLGAGSSTWAFEYDAEGRLTKACKSTSCATSGVDRLEFSYDGEGHRTQIKEYTAGTLTTTRDFRYQGDAIVEESTNGSVSRGYVVDDAGRVIRFCDPSCASPTTTYLVTWNGHGDALAIWRINGDGSLTLANSFTYSSWGAPTTATHNSIADLGFRFLYVGAHDVQWDSFSGLGLHYMHARHYSPAIGRFLQPDPIAAEANLYSYAGSSPISRADPNGTFHRDSDEGGSYAGHYSLASIERGRVTVRGWFDGLWTVAAWIIPGPKIRASVGTSSLQRAWPLVPRLTQGNAFKGLEHIVKKHWWSSGVPSVSKFARDFGARELKALIEHASRAAAVHGSTSFDAHGRRPLTPGG